MLCSFIGTLNEANSFYLLCSCITAVMIPTDIIIRDERSKWNSYCSVFPYSDAQIVSCKYIIGLILYGVSLILSFLSCIVRMSITGEFDWNSYFVSQYF